MRLAGVLSGLWCILCVSYLVCGGVCMFARCVKARRCATRDPAAGAQDPAWFPGALPLALRRSSLRFSGAGASLPALLLQQQLLRSAVMPLKHPLGSAHVAHGAAALCAQCVRAARIGANGLFFAPWLSIGHPPKHTHAHTRTHTHTHTHTHSQQRLRLLARPLL